MSTAQWTTAAAGTPCGMADGGVEANTGSICNDGRCGAQCDIAPVGVVPPFTPNPEIPCQLCDPGMSTSEWSAASDGTSCPPADGGGAAVCYGGTCHAGCYIAGGGFFDPEATQAGNPCAACEPVVSNSGWTNVGIGTSCGTGEICTADGSCAADCYVGTTLYPAAALNPSNACQVCTPSADTKTWSGVAAGVDCATSPDEDSQCDGSGACLATSTYSPVASPDSFALDGAGNVWVAFETADDAGYGSVASISPAGAVSGPFTVGVDPSAIAIDRDGNAWVTNSGDGTVSEVTRMGTARGPYSVGTSPIGIACDSLGNVWVAVGGDDSVVELSPAGALLATYQVGSYPKSIAIDGSDNVWVANYNGGSVSRIAHDGTVSGPFPDRGADAGTVAGAYGFGVNLAIDPLGNAWLCNEVPTNVFKVSPTGTVSGPYYIAEESYGYVGIAIDSAGNAWVSDTSGGTVTRISPSGELSNPYPVGQWPRGVTIDSSGYIWVALQVDQRVAKLAPSGDVVASYTAGGNPIDILSAPKFIWVLNDGDGSFDGSIVQLPNFGM